MATPAGQRNVFRFGLFEADPASGELLKQGEHVRLQDQPFRMLILLLERPGEVVTREELREKLWPQNTFVEFDNGLNVAVKKIRDALNDLAENPRFVETVPRRGYRFVAPVSIQTVEPSPRSPAPAPSLSLPDKSRGAAPASGRRRWLYYGSAAVLMAIVIAAAILNRVRSRQPTPPPAPAVAAITPRRMVAVLDFQNVSRRPADDWFSTAIAEMLTTELGAGEKLRLVPAEDVSRMKRELHLANSSSLARETAVAAAKNLKADMLVLGSFTAMGTGANRRVRIDVRMQNATDGEIVAEVAEIAPEEQLFELVSRAGTRLREALGLGGMSLPEQAAARASLPTNAVASRLYAEGLARLRILDAAGARDLLTQAVQAEPKFPLSHMALAMAWRTLGYDQKAKTEAKKAFDLSVGLSRADRLLIEGRFHEMSGEIDQAISSYRALFALFPDSLEDGLTLAEAQAWGGKPADALATLDALRRLPEPLSQDPRIDLRQAATLSLQGRNGGLTFIRQAEEKAARQGAPLLVAKAQVMECSDLLFTGHYDDAAKVCEESHRVFAAAGNAADTAQTARFLGDIRMRQGRLTDALELFQQAFKINQASRQDRGIAVTLNEMAIIYESQGDLKQAEDLYHRAYLLFVKLGHPKNAAMLAGNEGGIRLQEGKLAEAEALFQRALTLARESGSQDAEAFAHRTLSELARVRGRLDEALLHYQALQPLGAEQDPVGHVDDLVRLGRILAAQGDLAAARKNQAQALALAEKTGAHGQAAESRLALAELDVEDGHPAQAEQSIRNAIAVFRSEKMRDDELDAHLLLSRSLRIQGKVSDAQAAVNEIRDSVTRTQNPAIRLRFAITSARGGAANPAARRRARSDLVVAIGRAASLGFLPLQYEARLALGEIEIQDDFAAGTRTLAALEKDAHGHGFELIARKAAQAAVH
jgi:eukaryotic-like serine/threonine-protein kinase